MQSMLDAGVEKAGKKMFVGQFSPAAPAIPAQTSVANGKPSKILQRRTIMRGKTKPTASFARKSSDKVVVVHAQYHTNGLAARNLDEWWYPNLRSAASERGVYAASMWLCKQALKRAEAHAPKAFGTQPTIR
jgi:hypothetical protein